jgi:hypothetical protein
LKPARSRPEALLRMLTGMSTFIVRVVDASGGQLRGVVERVTDRHQVPFADQGQLLAVLTGDGSPGMAGVAALDQTPGECS